MLSVPILSFVDEFADFCDSVEKPSPAKTASLALLAQLPGAVEFTPVVWRGAADGAKFIGRSGSARPADFTCRAVADSGCVHAVLTKFAANSTDTEIDRCSVLADFAACGLALEGLLGQGQFHRRSET